MSRLDLISGWEQLPSGYRHGDVSDVAVDSSDNVYVLARRPANVFVYDSSGRFVRAFGQDVMGTQPHGITIGPDGSVYVVDQNRQCVFRFASDGSLASVIGVADEASDTGMDWANVHCWADFARATMGITGGPPFNNPTQLAIAPGGDLFVTDGYGNARVHRFDAAGTLVQSWGQPGSGEGEFRVPHGILITPDEKVYVADRENDRIQVFTLDGRFLDQWTDMRRPTAVAVDADGFFYVPQLATPLGHPSFRSGTAPEAVVADVVVYNAKGGVEDRIGATGSPCAPGNFLAPHGLAIDSRGDLYVGEIVEQALALPDELIVGEVADGGAGCHALQKFCLSTA